MAHHQNRYRKIGKTPAGNQRFQCKDCLSRFTFGSNKRVSHPMTKRYQNEGLYRAICNKTPLARLPEMLDMATGTLYRKIDMFYERSVAFMSERENQLSKKNIAQLNLSTDRQEYHANWTDEADKRHVVVTAIGTADKKSRYVFGMDANFDSTINLKDLHEMDEVERDSELPPYLRKYARLWTEADYLNAAKSNEIFTNHMNAEITHSFLDTEAKIEAVYSVNSDEWESEFGYPPEAFNYYSYLPQNGALVHLEYTMYAHFLNLRRLIGHSQSINFFVDRESGIHRALALAFGDRFESENFNALFVGSSKNLTIDERQKLVKDTKKLVKKTIKDYDLPSEFEAEMFLIEAATYMHSFVSHGHEFYEIPIHRINEAQKLISFITNKNKHDFREVAYLARQASLAPIDSYFAQVRRRIQSLERPIHTQSNNQRVWKGYSPYSPSYIQKQLQIFRCYHNYVLPGKDGKTPAERIGIAKGPVEIRKILYP
ncbi:MULTISPECIES: hypothetical protein [unclassified Marinobacterium]|uniref:hypothetical protein n=1 Tax=unclassified Marinobacterium TaxID=2644139 RepID=UPI00156A077B|nr:MULTISPECIES: hypothetical protein [unclassified Marinobacterium]